jgi:hypothetical protein
VVVTNVPGGATELAVHVLLDVDEVERDRAPADLLRAYLSVKPFTIEREGTGVVSYQVARSRTDRYRTAWYELQIRCDAGHVAASIDKSLADVLDGALEPNALERARARTDNVLRSSWLAMTGRDNHEDLVNALVDWRARGLSADPRIAYFEDLAQLDIAALDALRARMRVAPRRIAIVGNLSGLDRSELARFGTVTEVSVDQLQSASRQVAAPVPAPASGPAPSSKPPREGRGHTR